MSGGGVPAIPSPQEVWASGVRVAIGLPMERTVGDNALLHLWPIAQRGWPLVSARTYQRTDVNRNGFAQDLLKTDYTHLLMLDLDQLHPADTVERLARWVMDDPDKLVVASLSFRRGEPFDPLMFVVGPDGALHAPTQWPEGIVRAAVAGHGSILIHRSVFARIDWPWWAYTYQTGEDGAPTTPSEDMWFCQRLERAGIPLWVDTTTTAPHVTTATVDGESWRLWLADHPNQIIPNVAPREAQPVGASGDGE